LSFCSILRFFQILYVNNWYDHLICFYWRIQASNKVVSYPIIDEASKPTVSCIFHDSWIISLIHNNVINYFFRVCFNVIFVKVLLDSDNQYISDIRPFIVICRTNCKVYCSFNDAIAACMTPDISNTTHIFFYPILLKLIQFALLVFCDYLNNQWFDLNKVFSIL